MRDRSNTQKGYHILHEGRQYHRWPESGDKTPTEKQQTPVCVLPVPRTTLSAHGLTLTHHASLQTGPLLGVNICPQSHIKIAPKQDLSFQANTLSLCGHSALPDTNTTARRHLQQNENVHSPRHSAFRLTR